MSFNDFATVKLIPNSKLTSTEEILSSITDYSNSNKFYKSSDEGITVDLYKSIINQDISDDCNFIIRIGKESLGISDNINDYKEKILKYIQKGCMIRVSYDDYGPVEEVSIEFYKIIK